MESSDSVSVAPTITWDPGKQTSLNEADSKSLTETASDYASMEKLRVPPLTTFILLLLAGLVIDGVLIAFSTGDFFDCLLFLVPAIGWYFVVFRSLNQGAKISLAQQLHFLYAPRDNVEKWVDLKSRYPAMFDKGNSGQTLSDQLWGAASLDATSYPCWIALFTYVYDSKNGGDHGGGSAEVHTETVYGFHLPKVAQANFSLLPASLEHGSLETESAEFNRAFKIVFEGDKGLVGADILSVLNPLALEAFISFHAEFKPERITFQDEVLFVTFKGDEIIGRMNWLLNPKISAAALSTIEDKLHKIIALSLPIVVAER